MILVVVPALNEAETVGAVVREVRAAVEADVLVVDDGSTDATAERAAAAGARVLTHPFNLGVGAALRTGLRYARDEGYEALVQVDADGQHDPALVGLLLEPVLAGRADLVVGSRFGVSSSTYEAGPVRRMAMRALSRVISRRLRVPISDTTSGFRAFSSRAISVLAGRFPTEYLSDTVEVLLLAHDQGLVVEEVPATMRPRRGGRPSTSGALSALHLVRVILVVLLYRVRRPQTLRAVEGLRIGRP